MDLRLIEARSSDLEQILKLQKEAFAGLLEKYEDYDINPGNEVIGDIKRRYNQPFTDYLLIEYLNESIGAVRIIKNEEMKAARISPIFIIPKFQSKGLSQKAFSLIEDKYNWVTSYKLDTIMEEEKLCYLYEKLGYKKTGVSEKIKDGMTIVYYKKQMLK